MPRALSVANPDINEEGIPDGVLQQIIETCRHTIPATCETAHAIDRGVSVEEICTTATSDGLHDFSAAFFSADVEVVQTNHGPIETDETLLDEIDRILADYANRLPPNCGMVRFIKSGAQLELILEAAEAEGLEDLVVVLMRSRSKSSRETTPDSARKAILEH